MVTDTDEMMRVIWMMCDQIDDTWRRPDTDRGLWTGAYRAAENNPRDRIEMWIREGRFNSDDGRECLELALRIKKEFPEFGP